MKIFVLLALLVSLTSCKSKEGQTIGLLVDAAKEGIIASTCEIDIQYGNESSRIESFSFESFEPCDKITNFVGSKVRVVYVYHNISPLTNTNYIVESIELVK